MQSLKDTSERMINSVSRVPTTLGTRQQNGWLDNLRIQSKLGLIVAALGLGILATAITVFLGFNNLQKQFTSFSEVTLPSIDRLNQANTAFSDTQRTLLTLKNPETDPAARGGLIELVKANDLTIKEIIKQYQDVWQVSKRPELKARVGEDDLQSERSEERRVGKECLWLCRSRWSPYH